MNNANCLTNNVHCLADYAILLANIYDKLSQSKLVGKCYDFDISCACTCQQRIHVWLVFVGDVATCGYTLSPNMYMYVFSFNHGRWQDFFHGRGCRKIIRFSGGGHIMPICICTYKLHEWVLPKIIHVLCMLAVKFSLWAICINFSSALLYRFL